MVPASIPAIQRQNVAHTILILKAMGINDLSNFDFMDPPPSQTMITAMRSRYEKTDNRKAKRIVPRDPESSKLLIESVDLECSEEVLMIVAMISGATNVFYRTKEKQAQADAKKAKFYGPEGNHHTLLAVCNGWKNNKFSNPWCHENCEFCYQLALKYPYTNHPVFSFRSSNTILSYAIKPKWLTEVAPDFFKVANAKTIFKRKQNERVQPFSQQSCQGHHLFLNVKRSTRTSQTFG
ncbi:hypothetical protein Pst134EB_026292 [Puccinia striiformis f. sp. tritici]|nr:hypothetical protein Pst134EB_026292 [Puccinia striiformis f. sp. tritici]